MLDTDAISALQHSDRRIVDHLQAIDSNDIYVTVISLEEQLAGRIATLNKRLRPDQLLMGYTLLVDTHAFFAAAHLLPYDARSARIDLRLAGSIPRLGTKDRRIAAICLAHEAILITANTKHFSMATELLLIDWQARQVRLHAPGPEKIDYLE